MCDELQDTVSKSFHLCSSSLKWLIGAGIAAELIYHNRAGVAACQENLSLGALRFKVIHKVTQRFTKRDGNPCFSSCLFVWLHGRVWRVNCVAHPWLTVSSLLTMSYVPQFAPDESYHRC